MFRAPCSYGCVVSLHSFQDVKEQIRRNVDLVDLVSECVSLKRAGRSLKGLCPFHKEKTPSFNVLPERQIFKCFGCHVGGDIFKFVQLRENVGFAEALRILADRIGLELKPHPREAGRTPSVSRADIARANEWAATWFRQQLLSDAGSQARTYLESRRVAPEAAERFQIGLAPRDGDLQKVARSAGLSAQLLLAADLIRTGDRGEAYATFRERLVFPIRDASNRCIGFGGRALGDSPAKYLNTAQNELFNKSRCLFGIPLAREEIRRRGRVIVVEGYTDCIACHQYGFANTVATLGTAATVEHMRALRRYVDTAILLFDSDAAGKAAAERALAVGLQQNLTIKIAQVAEGKDPAEYLLRAGPEAFSDLLNSAVDALRFMWGRTLSRFTESGGGSSRRQAVVDFVNLVSESSRFGAVDAIQKGVIIHQVAGLLALPVEEVAGLFARRPPRRSPAATNRAASGARESSSSASADQLVLVDMLEILVCQPGLLEEVSEVFRAERFKDPAYRHIAEVFLGMAEQCGEFTASDLIAALESPVEAQLVVDMVFRREGCDDSSVMLADLSSRLQHLDTVRRSRAASERLRQYRPTDGSAEDALNTELAAVHEGCSLHRFAGQLSEGGAAEAS